MTDYPDDEDGAILAEIAAQGVDMTQPLVIEFPVMAPDEAAANNIAGAMANAGYEPQVAYDEGEPDFDPEEDDPEEFGPAWTVYAVVEMVPEYNEIMRIQSELNQIARPFGGNSEGWGVMLDSE